MKPATQLEMLHEGITDAQKAELRRQLEGGGWQTRKQLVSAIGWDERTVRAVAEVMGSEVVRGQRGFKLTNRVEREDFPAAIEACQAAISQGKKMIRYGVALRNRLNARLNTMTS